MIVISLLNCLVICLAVSVTVLLSLSIESIVQSKDYALAEAARPVMGMVVLRIISDSHETYLRGSGSQVRGREIINYPFQSPLHPALLRCSSVKKRAIRPSHALPDRRIGRFPGTTEMDS